jgi:hypothetical protein
LASDMGVVGVESSVSHTIVEVGHGRQWRGKWL